VAMSLGSLNLQGQSAGVGVTMGIVLGVGGGANVFVKTTSRAFAATT